MNNAPLETTSPTFATLLRRHPLISSVALEIVAIALVVAGALVLAMILPSLPGYSVTEPSQSLILVVVLAAALVIFVASLRWWRFAGFTRPAKWRDTKLYWFPLLLLGVPLLAGVQLPTLTAGGMLLLGYFATALFEEGLWRGVIVGLLRPLGVWPAVLISSLLFGLSHLGNSALRGFSVIILLQAFGAAVQGIGLAALRLRTNTIWPLIGIHALHDFSLQLGTMPIAAADAIVATAMAVYGVIILRRHAAERVTNLPLGSV